MKRILIIGNGLIGSYLRSLYNDDFEVASSQRGNCREEHYIDLSVPPSTWNVDFSCFNYVLIAAGIGGEDLCRVNPELSFRTNVEGTVSLLELLSSTSCKPIFFSSTYVNSFTSKSTDQIELFPYTYQKWLVEQEIFHSFPQAIVFRPGKVLSPTQTFIQQLNSNSKIGNLMPVFSDYFISPTSLLNLGRVVKKLLETDFSGPFNLVSDKPTSYFNLARDWCLLKGISANFLREVSYSGVKRDIEISHNISANDLAKISEIPETLEAILHSII